MKAKFTLIAVGCSLLLSACGGGGGGSTDTSPVVVNPPVVVPPVVVPPVVVPPVVVAPVTPPVVIPPVVTPTPGGVQTAVPPATYAANSQELAFFNLLNDFRSHLGLGLLAQNANLDKANQNHLKYLLTNTDVDFAAIDPASGRPFFHVENASRTNFTGVSETDRARYAFYTGAYVGETGAYGLGSGAAVALTNLIATVYHRGGLMYQFPRDIGIAVGDNSIQTIVMSFGYQTTGQKNDASFFGSYPADKQTGVPLVAYIETPNPFPEVAYIDFGTKTSFPINVVSEASTTLAVTSFTVTEAGQTTALDARLLTKANDPNKLLLANTAFLVGKAPFKAKTTYNVKFVGTVDGAQVTKEWSFTTGG